MTLWIFKGGSQVVKPNTILSLLFWFQYDMLNINFLKKFFLKNCTRCTTTRLEFPLIKNNVRISMKNVWTQAKISNPIYVPKPLTPEIGSPFPKLPNSPRYSQNPKPKSPTPWCFHQCRCGRLGIRGGKLGRRKTLPSVTPKGTYETLLLYGGYTQVFMN